MFFISQGTNLLCKKLHFCFSVLLSPVSHAHRNTTVATSDRLNYLIFYWKHLRLNCLGDSDLCWSQLTAIMTLKSSTAAWSANLIPFQQSRAIAVEILVSGRLWSSSNPNCGVDGTGPQASLQTSKLLLFLIFLWGLYAPHFLLISCCNRTKSCTSLLPCLSSCLECEFTLGSTQEALVGVLRRVGHLALTLRLAWGKEGWQRRDILGPSILWNK